MLVALVLDVSEPDLTPVENLLTPTMLDVLAQAAAAAEAITPCRARGWSAVDGGHVRLVVAFAGGRGEIV